MADEKSLKTLTMVVYALQALGFLNGITWIVAVIINYVKKDEVRGSWLESHFRWQIRTFWWGLLWGVIGTVLVLVLVGWPRFQFGSSTASSRAGSTSTITNRLPRKAHLLVASASYNPASASRLLSRCFWLSSVIG